MKMSEKPLMTLSEQIEPGHTAVIVMDPQKAFCDSDGFIAKVRGKDVSRIQASVKRLNPFIEKTRQIGIPIIWVRGSADSDRKRPNQKAMMAKHSGGMKTDGDGMKWYSQVVKPLPIERVITKYNYDAFADTELDLLLKSKGIKTLLFTGFLTNICVETSARHAYINGYYIVFVSDCTDTNSQQEYESSLFNIDDCFGEVVTSNEILKIWKTKKD
jgi:ureidoacrylate peracid hydrolase